MRKKFFIFVLYSVFISACGIISTSNVPAEPQTVALEPKALQVTAPCPTCPPVPTCPPALTATQTTPPTLTPTIPPTLTKTALPTFTPTVSNRPYIIQPGSPTYLKSFAYPALGCNWVGVAGQVFDKSGKPLGNLVVVIEGRLAGKVVDLVTLSGRASVYGPGGYELKLGDKPVDSTGTLYLTVYDLTGIQLSESVILNTSASCDKNLILLNFVAR